MPKVDGLEVLRRIKADPQLRMNEVESVQNEVAQLLRAAASS